MITDFKKLRSGYNAILSNYIKVPRTNKDILNTYYNYIKDIKYDPITLIRNPNFIPSFLFFSKIIPKSVLADSIINYGIYYINYFFLYRLKNNPSDFSYCMNQLTRLHWVLYKSNLNKINLGYVIESLIRVYIDSGRYKHKEGHSQFKFFCYLKFFKRKTIPLKLLEKMKISKSFVSEMIGKCWLYNSNINFEQQNKLLKTLIDLDIIVINNYIVKHIGRKIKMYSRIYYISDYRQEVLNSIISIVFKDLLTKEQSEQLYKKNNTA